MSSAPRTTALRGLPTILLLCAGTAAQAPDHLVGITRNAPFLRHVDQHNCTLLGQCGLPGMPPSTPLPPYVGGADWDPIHGGAWVTNGLLLANYDDSCVVQCPPNAIPGLAAGAFATGLAFLTGARRLWLIDSLGGLHFFDDSCPPVPLGVCNTWLGPVGQQVTTAIAVDEAQGIVFIAYPDFATGANTIVVSTTAAPCAGFSTFVLPACAVGLGPVLGLDCDWGKSVLYATDGVRTIEVPYAWAPPNVVTFAPVCCPGAAGADPMIGLAVRPGRATPTGAPCANGSCAPCPMQHTLGNDPVLGNAAFRLELAGAPAGSFAFCLIGQGPCLVPGLVAVPFCGPIHTIPYLGNLGAIPTGGVGACDGSASFGLSLPSNPALANNVFSTQCVSVCVAGALGVASSNCLSWELQGL